MSIISLKPIRDKMINDPFHWSPHLTQHSSFWHLLSIPLSLNSPQHHIHTLWRIPLPKSSSQQTMFLLVHPPLTTIEMMWSDPKLGWYRVVKTDSSKVIIPNHAMVGTVADVFDKRIRDVQRTSRKHTACKVVSDGRVLDVKLVLIVTSSLQRGRERFDQRGMKSWHDDGGWWKSSDGDCWVDDLSLDCPIWLHHYLV